ncbi:TPA: antibiotic biosynthesis monooxygenase [Burkholderia cenocepacia]|nr:antibiotic biosynthesis monooxygenase [Burkholderia cenocepacia]
MLLIIGEVRFPLSKVEEAKPELKKLIDASRMESGCLEFTCAEDLLEAGLIRIREAWRDRAAFNQHAASEHMASWLSGQATKWITERKITMFNAEEVVSQ